MPHVDRARYEQEGVVGDDDVHARTRVQPADLTRRTKPAPARLEVRETITRAVDKLWIADDEHVRGCSHHAHTTFGDVSSHALSLSAVPVAASVRR